MDTRNNRKSRSIENLDFRFGSSSSQTSSSGDFCRICHETDAISPLLAPCLCSGSLRFVHQNCLQQWLTCSETTSCELCKFPFIMQSKIKPFNEWRSLDMSGVERRRLFCAVLFHLAAALCVIWSLCVLIERSAEEVRLGKLGWPFWTKLVVVTVGLTGGIVFMYIQCKQYLHLCARWRARNRILLIQNAPEKPHPPSHSPVINQNQSSVEPNASLRRNDSSILVITAPLNNVMENNEQNQHYHHFNSAHPSHRQQSQIVANIENNSMSYELDDDISQISFKQHLRQDEGTSSRGSLHNVYDNTSVSTTNTSATTRNLTTGGGGGDNDSNFQRIIPGLEEVKEHDDDDKRKSRRSDNNFGTSIFVENSDILSDDHYPKISHRHSTLLLPTTTYNSISTSGDEELDKRYQKKPRRYSDTKLLNSCNFENEFLINKTNVFGSPTKKKRNEANITDLIFEKSDDFDPIELNIQKVLEMDIRSNNNINKNSSADSVLGGDEKAKNSQKTFKSLPNLDADIL